MSADNNKSGENASDTLGGDQLFHDLFDDSPEAIALSQGEIVVFRRRNSPERYDFITPGIEQLTGHSANGFTPEMWDQLVEEVHLRGELAGLSFEEARRRYLKGEVTRWYSECVIRHRDGGRRVVLDLSVPLRSSDGSVKGSFGFLHDVTAQRAAGMILGRKSRAVSTKPAGLPPTVIWMTDARLLCTMSEGTGLQSTGMKPGEFVGRHISEYFGTSGTSDSPVMAAHHRALTGEAVDYELHHNGHHFVSHIEPVRDERGNVTGLVGVSLDVTSSRETEARLLQREAYERALLQAIPDLIAVIDSNGNYVDFKADSALDTSQKNPSVIGRNLRDLPFHPDDFPRLGEAVRAAITGGKAQHLEYRYASDEGPTWWDARIAHLDTGRVIMVARDITARRHAEEENQRIEEQMRSAQQLESLGVLAGGIAHDFNNLLVGVLGNAEIALKELPPGHTADCIAEIKTAAIRAAELTNLMLAYAGRAKFQTAILDLNVIACEMTQLVQAAISKKVTLHFELDRTLAPIHGDAAQLRQVIMNLVVNAAESFGEHEGEVVLRTGHAQITAADLVHVLPAGIAKPGHYNFLEVRDQGCGMDATTVRRIFEPFFTTKFTGRGLGLSASIGILRSHGGCIHVESEPDKGSTFTIFLPPVEVVNTTSETATSVPKRPDPAASQITGRILVVDDEDIVRRVVKRQLERAGFSVLLESDGRQAVQLLADQPDLIDLVLLDLTMPGMGGEEVLLYLRTIGFKHPVVLMSGYDESEASTIARKLGVYAFIRKPFTTDLLVDTLRAAILASRTAIPSGDTDVEDRS